MALVVVCSALPTETVAAPIEPTVIAVEPARLLDTRPGFATIDGDFAGGGPNGAGEVLRVQVAGRGGVAAEARAAFVNVTVVNPRGPGHATVFSCGDVPLASTLNHRTGQTIANTTIARLDDDGGLCISTFAETDLVVDATGYFPSEDQWTALPPARLFDGRPTGRTVDGQFQGGGQARARQRDVFGFIVAGRGGVSSHPGEPVSAVALNVTVADALTDGYVTVRPCGAASGTSTVNFGPGDTVANGVIVPMDANGRVCVESVGLAYVIADVVAVDPTLSDAFDRVSLESMSPARLLDTRPGNPTVDGEFSGGGPNQAGTVTRVRVAGRGGVPIDATAALVNLTIVGAEQPGHATVFPCTDTPPNASTSNVADQRPIANNAFIKLSAEGDVCVYTRMTAHVVLDATGSTYVAATS